MSRVTPREGYPPLWIIGTYILVSLEAIAFCVGLLGTPAYGMAKGFDLGPTYSLACECSSGLSLANPYVTSGISSGKNSIPAFVNASVMASAAPSSLPQASGTRMPKAKFPANIAGCINVCQPASRNIAAISAAKFCDSGSLIKCQSLTEVPCNFPSACLNNISCSSETRRHANSVFNRCVSNSAFAARSAAIAVRSSANPLSNSSWATRSFASATMPSPASFAFAEKWSSPQTPIQIHAADAMVIAPGIHGQTGGMNTPIISTANPNKMKRASRCDRSELSSYLDWRLFPLLIGYIMPRSVRGSKLTTWLAGIDAVGSVLALIFFVVGHLMGWLH